MTQYAIKEGVRVSLTPEEVAEIEAYTPPPEPLKPISQRQLRLLLLSILGPDYETQVLAAIANISDDTERAAAEIGWEYASQFEPTNDLVLTIRDALGMTREDFEAHWRTAQTL